MKDYANWLPDEYAEDVVGKVVKEQILNPKKRFWTGLLHWKVLKLCIGYISML
ncbi:hypothetical protein QWZ08_06890 [Ferruginibacter paludis]|uniref:hypothetical protein n=1 Tax=Ferruginibacter paludis TaxID=1310417 RepID=UPI0025B4B5C2|nr:hypothetical protein [Ferruginibacter paludis]MDN3655342.1 hypothetical protein [Ferruginibacter paludis]